MAVVVLVDVLVVLGFLIVLVPVLVTIIGHRNLTFKFGQIGSIIADILFLLLLLF